MHALIRRLLLVAAVLAVGSSLSGQTLRDSTLDSKPSWLYYFNTTSVTFKDNPYSAAAGDNYLSVDPQQHVVAFFEKTTGTTTAPVTIESGSTLQVSFDLYFTASLNTTGTGGLRFGLFDSNGAAKPTANNSFHPYDGYLVAWNPGNLNAVRFWKRNAPTNGSQQLMNSTGVYTQVGSDVDSTYVFQTGTAYRASYSVTGGNDGGLTFAVTINEGSTLRFSNSVSVVSPSTNVFDAFAMYAVSGGPSFGVDNLLINYTATATSSSSSGVSAFDLGGPTAIPEPSTYAACAGAAVLGLAFWRRRRAAAHGGSS